MYTYMRNDTPDEWGIKKLQEKILEIAVYVDAFCDENGIEYCLMGGSALGAVRHGGFIPWDDDLDFFMTPDNYEKFVRLFEEKGDKNKFFLEPFGHIDNMITLGKVRAKNTTYIAAGVLFGNRTNDNTPVTAYTSQGAAPPYSTTANTQSNDAIAAIDKSTTSTKEPSRRSTTPSALSIAHTVSFLVSFFTDIVRSYQQQEIRSPPQHSQQQSAQSRPEQISQPEQPPPVV